MLGLLGDYDSDEEQARIETARKNAATLNKKRVAVEEQSNGSSSSSSDSEEFDDMTIRRFLCKNLLVVNDTFRCALCPISDVFEKKLECETHIRERHHKELSSFCAEKQVSSKPKLAPKRREEENDRKKIKADFSVEAVLGKPIHDPKKPKVTLSGPTVRIAKSEPQVSVEDLVKKIEESLEKKFLDDGLLYIDKHTTRCKLCSNKFPSGKGAKDHLMTVHGKEYEKDMLRWQRFVQSHVSREDIKCLVCLCQFPAIEDVAHHIGVQVWILNSKTHREAYAYKLRLMQKSEDDQCCGDGIVIHQMAAFEEENANQSDETHDYSAKPSSISVINEF